jgi:catechol 2,3-dioxygenase-like lactoylglutathione lyase family enzyme
MMDQARTVPDDFPTDGVELSCFLVVSDYARALAFYRDVLGATVVRELPGTLCFLNFRGSQILLSAPFGPTKDQQAPPTSVIYVVNKVKSATRLR